MPTVDALNTLVKNDLRDTQLGTRTIDAINWARRYIQTKANWGWSGTTEASIRTIAPADYTSVSVTSGSATVTVDSNNAAQAQITTDIALDVYHFATFGGGGDRFYRILARSYAAPTATLTITPAFIGTTSTTDTMTVYFREYPLPADFVRERSVLGEDGAPLTRFDIDALWYMNGRPTAATAKPAKYAIRNEVRSKLILDPIPDDVYSIPYEYEPSLPDVAAGGTEASVLVPPRWHHTIVALALFYLRHNYKDDDRAPADMQLANSFLSEMIREQQTGGGQFLPVVNGPRSERARLQRSRINGRGYGGAF